MHACDVCAVFFLRWPNIPKDSAAAWTYAIDLNVSTAMRMVSQTDTSSWELLGISLCFGLVEIISRLMSVIILRREIRKVTDRRGVRVSIMQRRPSVNAPAPRPADAVDMNQQKRNQLDAKMEIYGDDLGANMLAEHSSIWIISTYLLFTFYFPFNTDGPVSLSPEKIILDFFIQLGCELVSDLIGLWVSYRFVGLSPMNVFRFRDNMHLSVCFFAITALVAAYMYSPRYSCAMCSLWDADECLASFLWLKKASTSTSENLICANLRKLYGSPRKGCPRLFIISFSLQFLI